MESRKRALMFAKRFRTCPPPAVARDPSQKALIDRHLSLCPYCAEEGAEKAEIWQRLAEGVRDILLSEAGAAPVDNPEPGDIRPIRAELGRWREDAFYNPPLVLVVETHAPISDVGLLRIAQTYHDLALAGPGDLVLQSDRSPIGEIFIEPWNTYSLRAADLGPVIGKVGPDVVDAVKALEADPDAYIEWAMHPRPMAPEDPRLYFREMEVEVGYVFASESVSAILEHLERPLLRLAYRAPEEAMKDIARQARDVHWPAAPKTIELVLATAQFPPERYAMAAAEAEQALLRANLVTVRAGRIVAVEPIDGEILQREAGPEGLAIGGRLFLPRDVEISGLLFFFRTREGQCIAPQCLDWDARGSFLATFEGLPMIEGEISLAAIQEAGDG
jgi:hypothetical protein